MNHLFLISVIYQDTDTHYEGVIHNLRGITSALRRWTRKGTHLLCIRKEGSPQFSRGVFYLMTLPFLLSSARRLVAILLCKAPRDHHHSCCSLTNTTAVLLPEISILLKTSLVLHSCACTEQEYLHIYKITKTISISHHCGIRIWSAFRFYTCPAQEDRDLNSLSDKRGGSWKRRMITCNCHSWNGTQWSVNNIENLEKADRWGSPGPLGTGRIFIKFQCSDRWTVRFHKSWGWCIG